MSNQPVIIDASNSVLGRVASVVAKRALEGDEIVVVNVEKAVITGKRLSIIADAHHRLETTTHQNQERAPIHFRKVDLIARRTIRGMLPWKKSSGKIAFKKIQVYVGIPPEYSSKSMCRIAGAEVSKLDCKYMTLEELSRAIGGEST